MSHLQILAPPAHCHLHCCGNLPYYKHTTTRLPFLDLHRSRQSTKCTPCPRRTTILYKPTGAAIPPIPPNLVKKLNLVPLYVSVIARKQPQRVPDLMGYQVLILEASSEYKNDCWMAYDRHFCPRCHLSTTT